MTGSGTFYDSIKSSMFKVSRGGPPVAARELGVGSSEKILDAGSVSGMTIDCISQSLFFFEMTGSWLCGFRAFNFFCVL